MFWFSFQQPYSASCCSYMQKTNKLIINWGGEDGAVDKTHKAFGVRDPL